MKHVIKLLPSFVAVIVVAAVLVVVYLQTSEYLKLRKLDITSQAVDGCLKNSSYTFTGNGITTVEPIEKDYQICLQLKGLSNQ